MPATNIALLRLHRQWQQPDVSLLRPAALPRRQRPQGDCRPRPSGALPHAVEVPESLKQAAEAVAVPEEVVAVDERHRNLKGFWDKFKDRLVDLFKEEEDRHL